jgi:cytochrome c oxidase subunit 2
VKEQKAASPAAQVASAAPVAAAAPAEDPNKKWTADELKAMGEKLYAANCLACHQATGKGMPPAFPPLDGSKVVTGAKGAQLALVLNGKPNTAMASFARLSDTEIAAIITYTRTAWGNKAGEVQPSEVKAARKG